MTGPSGSPVRGSRCPAVDYVDRETTHRVELASRISSFFISSAGRRVPRPRGQNTIATPRACN
jgi:hypothetical protein